MSENAMQVPTEADPQRPGSGGVPQDSAGTSEAVHPGVLDDLAVEDPLPRQARTVPYGALAEERARRKELQRELQSALEAQQKLQGRLDALHGLAQQYDAPEIEAGDGEPRSQVRDAPAEVEQRTPEGPGPEPQADTAFRTQVVHSVRDSLRERPDFLAAYQHARQARVSELCALGYTPDEALGVTFENELEVIHNAYASGRNPADLIYEYALRHGYQAPSWERNSIVASRAAPAPALMTEAEKVALAARGQAASKSLSMAGGGSAPTLTLESLANMSDEEFAEATKGDRWHKLLG